MVKFSGNRISEVMTMPMDDRDGLPDTDDLEDTEGQDGELEVGAVYEIKIPPLLALGRWRQVYHGPDDKLEEYLDHLGNVVPLPKAQGNLASYQLQDVEEDAKGGYSGLLKYENLLPLELLKYARAEEPAHFRNQKLLEECIIRLLDYPSYLFSMTFREELFFVQWMKFLYRMILMITEEDPGKVDNYKPESPEWCDLLSTVVDYLTEDGRRNRLWDTILKDRQRLCQHPQYNRECGGFYFDEDGNPWPQPAQSILAQTLRRALRHRRTKWTFHASRSHGVRRPGPIPKNMVVVGVVGIAGNDDPGSPVRPRPIRNRTGSGYL